MWAELGSLAWVALLLGIQHGFDADHLAAIDGLTRYNGRQRPAIARYVGSLFSLGHGLIVISVALVVSTVAAQWTVPSWIEATGAWISISALTLLALLNLRNLLRTPAHEMVQVAGLRSGLLGKVLRTQQAWAVFLVGGLFALSFDTLSQATLFAITATRFGGWEPAVLLAAMFMLGMLITDGLNGLWIARLIQRADATARLASRVMTIAVSGVSLLTAAVGASVLSSEAFAEWVEPRGWLLSVGILVVIAISFLLGHWLAGRSAVSESASPASTAPVSATAT